MKLKAPATTTTAIQFKVFNSLQDERRVFQLVKVSQWAPAASASFASSNEGGQHLQPEEAEMLAPCSFSSLLDKLMNVFCFEKSTFERDCTILYQDIDGDKVTMSTDRELQIAIEDAEERCTKEQRASVVVKLFLQQKQQQQSSIPKLQPDTEEQVKKSVKKSCKKAQEKQDVPLNEVPVVLVQAEKLVEKQSPELPVAKSPELPIEKRSAKLPVEKQSPKLPVANSPELPVAKSSELPVTIGVIHDEVPEEYMVGPLVTLEQPIPESKSWKRKTSAPKESVKSQSIARGAKKHVAAEELPAKPEIYPVSIVDEKPPVEGRAALPERRQHHEAKEKPFAKLHKLDHLPATISRLVIDGDLLVAGAKPLRKALFMKKSKQSVELLILRLLGRFIEQCKEVKHVEILFTAAAFTKEHVKGHKNGRIELKQVADVLQELQLLPDKHSAIVVCEKSAVKTIVTQFPCVTSCYHLFKFMFQRLNGDGKYKKLKHWIAEELVQ